MKYLFALVFICPAIAYAQSQPQGDTPTTSGPTGIGAPHVCGQKYYPVMATRLGIEGVAILTFRIGTDGIPKDIAVAKSAGSLDLDYAAVNCAANWLYKPAIQDGHPVDVPWLAKISWQLNYGPPASVPPIAMGGPHTCESKPLTTNSVQAPTVIAYLVGAEGDVKNVQILQSSGDRIADVYGASCVSQWKFTPAKNEGGNVQVEKFATLNWNQPAQQSSSLPK